MKKLLGLSLVCAFFLAMLSMPTTAEAAGWKTTRTLTDAGVDVVQAQCTNDGTRFELRRPRGKGWSLRDYGGMRQINEAGKYANKHGGGNPEKMADIFCRRPKK